jgi:hypothetical protein
MMVIANTELAHFISRTRCEEVEKGIDHSVDFSIVYLALLGVEDLAESLYGMTSSAMRRLRTFRQI